MLGDQTITTIDREPSMIERKREIDKPKWSALLSFKNNNNNPEEFYIAPKMQGNHGTPKTNCDSCECEQSLSTKESFCKESLKMEIPVSQCDCYFECSINDSPLSPMRSPMCADWKTVGSPIIADHDDIDISIEKKDSVDAIEKVYQRKRAKSLFETYTAFEDVINSTSAALSTNEMAKKCSFQQGSVAESDKLETLGKFEQKAQLPQNLHKELGFDTMDNSIDLNEDIKALNTSATISKEGIMPSLFQKMPFGPNVIKPLGKCDNERNLKEETEAAEVSISPITSDAESSPIFTHEDEEFKPDSTKKIRRHSSLFGLSEWAPDFGTEMGSDFSIEDFHSGRWASSYCTTPIGSSPIGDRPIFPQNPTKGHSRRHSIAAPDMLSQFDSKFGNLNLKQSSANLESNLSPSAESFHFKRFPTPDTNTISNFISSASNPSSAHSYCQSTQNVPMPQIQGNSNSKYSKNALRTYQSSSTLREADFQLSTYKGPLFAVEFKAGRTEIFYILEDKDCNPELRIAIGDLVIVEADRGEDLGKVTIEISVDRLTQLMMPQSKSHSLDKDSDILTPELASLVHSKEIVPKRIHRMAHPTDMKLLQAKAQEEAIAMVRCQSRIRQKKLPMEVVDAEYQWDRNKLTFYFCADRRIDFRELVRDLFRIYKTRIWMCAVDKTNPRMVVYSSANGAGCNTVTPGTFKLLDAAHGLADLV